MAQRGMIRNFPPVRRDGRPVPPSGMRGDLDPAALGPDQLATMQGFRVDQGIWSSRNMGTGAALNANAMAFDVREQWPFRSPLSGDLLIGFTSGGKLAYTTDDWATWNGEYIQSADGTDLVFESGITGGPHIIPNATVRGDDIVFSNGVDDVYRVDGALWVGSGRLKATALTGLPPFLDATFLCGRMSLSDGEALYLTAPEDPNRCYSKQTERTDGVYDDNLWNAPADEGAPGFITAIRAAGETTRVVATSKAIWWYALDLTTAGKLVPNLIPMLTDAGCPSGACCFSMGRFYFLSDFGGGTWLGLKRGALSEGEGTQVEIEAKNGWVVYEVAPGLRKLLALVRPSDFAVLHAGVMGTPGSWEKVPAGARANLDTSTDPGWIYVNAMADIAYTPSALAGAGVESPTLTNGSQLYNGIPTYPATAPDTNTCQFSAIPRTMMASIAGSSILDIRLRLNSTTGEYLTNEAGAPIQINAAPTGWQTHLFNTLKYVTALYIEVTCIIFTPIQIYEQKIYLALVATTPAYISGIRIFGWNKAIGAAVTSNEVLAIPVHQIKLLGAGSDTATWIGEIEKVSGLTASSNLEFGRMRFRQRSLYDDSGYAAVSARVGKSATLATLGATTLSAGITAGDTTCAVAAVPAGSVAGDQISMAAGGGTAETRYIRSISGTTVTMTAAWGYNHANGTAATFLGSTASSTNWSAWTLLTLAELRAGKKLRDFLINSAAPTSDSSGNAWVQMKIGITIDTKTGASPAVNIAKSDFIKGSLALSNHFMAAGPANHLLLAAPGSSGSTDNDTLFYHYPAQAASGHTAGQHIYSLVQSGKDFIVNTGRKMAKLWTGDYNYAGTSSTDTALTRRLKWPKIVGRALRLLGISLDVEKFNETVITPRTATLTLDSDAYRLYNRGSNSDYAPTLDGYSGQGLGSQLQQSVKVGDATYFVQAGTSQGALYLRKFENGTAVTVATLIATASPVFTSVGGDMTWDGTYLWLAYWGLKSTWTSGAVFKVMKYNPATGGSQTWTAMSDLAATHVAAGCCIRYFDGNIHLAARMQSLTSPYPKANYYTNQISNFATSTACLIAADTTKHGALMWIEDHVGCLQLIERLVTKATLAGARLTALSATGVPTWSTTGVFAFTSLASEAIDNYSVRYDAGLARYVVMYTEGNYGRIYAGTTAYVFTRLDSGDNVCEHLKIARLSNGHILFLYLNRTSSLWYYRTWDGTTLSAATTTGISGPNSLLFCQWLADNDPDVQMWLCYDSSSVLQAYEVRNYELLGDSGMGQLYVNTDNEKLLAGLITEPSDNIRVPASGTPPTTGSVKTLQPEFETDVPCEIRSLQLTYTEQER